VGSERVWLAVYDKEDERKLRLWLGLIEEATNHSGHRWTAIDLSDAFADQMCGLGGVKNPSRAGPVPFGGMIWPL